MKTIKFLQILLFILTLSSCKKESKVDSTVDTKVLDKKIFKVTLDVTLKRNDTLHLYYTEDNTLNFNEENSIWTSVAGKEAVQEVNFELPEDVFPTLFRIDLGVNKENEKIIFNGFKFDYLGNIFKADETTVYNYFRVNTDNTNFDSITKELSRKNPSIDAGPCLYPLEASLKTEIDKLYK